MPRRYQMRLRKENMEDSRAAIVNAARSIIESDKLISFSLESVAKAASVSRATIYNLFKSKSELIHAVCDRVAVDSGLIDVDHILNDPDPWSALNRYVAAFVDFYSLNRNLFRRFRVIAATDREFSEVITLRENRKRIDGLTKILKSLHGDSSKKFLNSQEIDSQALMLKALLCFEVFDTLCENNAAPATVKVQIQVMVLSLVKNLLEHDESLVEVISLPDYLNPIRFSPSPHPDVKGEARSKNTK